jgi:hypothetical protein
LAVGAVFSVLLEKGVLNILFFAIQTGTAQKAFYSGLYPMPIYYLVVTNWYDNFMHPISLLLYAIGLSGLGLMAYRRKRVDKFLLLWFVAVYLVFSLIPNKDWRYVTIAFPVLAISTAMILTTSYGKLAELAKTSKSFARKWSARSLKLVLVALVLTGVFLSCADAYMLVSKDRLQVPVEQATDFASQGLSGNQTLVVACPLNFLNEHMVRFYLNVRNANQNYNQVWQYPSLAIDAYALDFNVSQFASLCQSRNVKYVMLYEFGNQPYFNSTVTAQTVFSDLNETDRFTLQASFGSQPNRVFVLSFT